VSPSRREEASEVQRKPARSSSVAWQTIDGETVLLRVKEKELIGLNEVGRRIWELSDGSRSIGQIAETLSAEYRVDHEAARADALRFIRELQSIHALDWPPD